MKKVLFVIVLIASFLVIRNLGVSIYNLWQKQHLITRIQTELEQEKKRNKELKEKITQAQSVEFIEEEARNKLFMVKEGEQEILISRKLLEPQGGGNNEPSIRSNWQQWIEVLF